jgi:hypothetical protein
MTCVKCNSSCSESMCFVSLRIVKVVSGILRGFEHRPKQTEQITAEAEPKLSRLT